MIARLLRLSLIGVSLAASPLCARLTETAKVRYDVQDSVSDWYTVDVTFVTGSELNQLTGTLTYNSYKSFAVIFFGRDLGGKAKAAVISLDSGIYGCGGSFTASCLPMLGRMSGPDQEGRNWELCTAWIC